MEITEEQETKTRELTVETLLDSGVHFGHRVSRRDPKMEPFIFGKRNLINIIDLRHTVRGIVRACHFLEQLCSGGAQVLFVGTKRQAKNVVKVEAQRCEMHWVTERWLGGTLTNFETVRSRLKRLDELEQLELDGGMELYSKKIISSLLRQKRKIKRNLEGVRKMEKRPEAMIVVDPRREHIAVREAAKLRIPVIALLDTDCDPTLVDICIPGNDDAMRSIELVLRMLTDSILDGRKRYQKGTGLNLRTLRGEPEVVAEPSSAIPPKDELKRHRRTQARKQDGTPDAPAAEEPRVGESEAGDQPAE